MRYAGGYWLDAVGAERPEDGRTWTRLIDITRGHQTQSDSFLVAQLAVLVIAILGTGVVSALDYISAFATSIPRMFEAESGAAAQEAATLSIMLYTLRHSALYVFLRRWLLYGGADTI